MLAVVPVRGGSQGVRRKNLRDFNGVPLFLHKALQLRSAGLTPTVCTDSGEVRAIAEAADVRVIRRPDATATPAATIQDLVTWLWEAFSPDVLGIFQCTSPLTGPEIIREAITAFTDDWSSLATVTAESHIVWRDDHPLVPRVNRQYSDSSLWRETGAVQLTRTGELVTACHRLFPVTSHASIDIDALPDLDAARRSVGRRSVTFVITAGATTGHGHLHRCLTLADLLPHHDVRFDFAYERSRDAIDAVIKHGYLIDEGRYVPDVTVFDALDVSAGTVLHAKAHGSRVMTLEDLGEGAYYADVVVNELYDGGPPGVLCGPRYAVLRPEFTAAGGQQRWHLKRQVNHVLLTFGGTDPAGMVERLRRPLTDAGVVVTTPGPSMAASMIRADLVITSAGRTVHEAAALGVPCVSIPVNERESRHAHVDGIFRMPPRWMISDEQVVETVRRLLGDLDLRVEHARRAKSQIDGLGARRIVHLIEGLMLEV